jgi:SAM-dependent methyltransferase
MSYFNIFVDPVTKQRLEYRKDTNDLFNPGLGNNFPIFDKNIVSFLETKDEFYEGAYLNKIHYIPKIDVFPFNFPLWLLSNGYVWEVRKQIPKNSRILELGCASGINYFANNYKMFGLDVSRSSLEGLENYQLGIQADASSLPFESNTFDAIISSYFWEHIPPQVKDQMLKEFQRVLRPGGKVVFLYDVATNNGLINRLKAYNPQRYKELFLDKDGHFGYETPSENAQRFIEHGFKIQKHFGMERTWVQSNSVFEKLRHLPGFLGSLGALGYLSAKNNILTYFHILFVRIIDVTIGRFFDLDKSRIIVSVLVKNSDGE